MNNSEKVGNISEIVKKIAKPIANDLGFEIWDVKFLKEGPNYILRVFIDKTEGITIEDCEMMSRALDSPLDESDPIPYSYCLEVCSPGIDRELVNDEHLKKFIGSEIKIRMIRPNADGEKEIVGILTGFDKENILINFDQTIEKSIERKLISHINLNF